MADWVVRKWARYGHERLYAETPGGTALGYLDVKTGRFHSDDVTNLPLLERLLAGHLSTQEPTSAARGVLTHAEPPTPPAVAIAAELTTQAQAAPGWEDLSATKAGAAAREQALAEKEAAGRFRTGLARLLGVRTDERAWRIGADGEEAVAAQLARLGPDWHVLHAVRVGERGSDIDHVVIGPGGVFTVNAKHHPRTSVWVGGDTVMINGQRVPYVRNSRHEARRAARLLTEQAGFPITVVGIIAIVGAHDGFTVKQQPKDGAVTVVARTRISQHLVKLPTMLTQRGVDAVFEIARRSTTWR